jgi:hypothetical protein
MPTLRQAVRRLRAQGMLPPSGAVSVKNLNHQFRPEFWGSTRSLLSKMFASYVAQGGGSTHPYYRRVQPSPSRYDALADISFGDGTYVDFSDPRVHLIAFGQVDAVATAAALFDHRAAALLHAARGLEDDNFWARVSLENPMSFNTPQKRFRGLLAQTKYDDAPDVWSPTTKCLAMLAYADYFRGGRVAGSLVSEAVTAANPGWCGAIGPGVDDLIDVLSSPPKGDYDFEQMHLIPMAYSYYDDLTSDAREHLITSLLAGGRIHGPGQDDTHTCGPYPEYWSRAGVVKLPDPLGLTSINLKRIGETENHILMIMTARYLTNQLLYQRSPTVFFDNRRNSPAEVLASNLEEILSGLGIKTRLVAPHKEPSPGSCTSLMLSLLQGMLTDDFSEYNSKPYQRFTRYALLNLCTYAYDHEVRLAARMVLDYVSAHFAVSSNDLRRIVPFRRRNEDPFVAHDPKHGFMTAGILEWQDGADSTGRSFAILAGNIRAFQSLRPVQSLRPAEFPDRRQASWSIRDNGEDQVIDVVSDYRLPPSIHALFVNDPHRRFYQRLHRFRHRDESENRNCDNMELYAGSPSYLITAGGAPATYAIDPHFLGVVVGPAEATTIQLGVAVTTSFMPTTRPNLDCGDPSYASDLIQFSRFSDDFDHDGEGFPEINSYGVAPDFACGYGIHLPDWVRASADPPFGDAAGFHFVNRGSDGSSPGFYLAIYKDGDYACLEAFDTWLHPPPVPFEPLKEFERFKRNVLALNGNISLREPSLNGEQGALYTTQNGTQVNFLIWRDHTDFARPDSVQGAKVFIVKYGAGDPNDQMGDAGNVADPFLNGTILNSRGQGKIEISNPSFGDKGTTITLDMSDALHPKRTSETSEVEEAGSNHEVWVNFGWTGPSEGDFFRPFNTITAAAEAVANGGVIKIMPGWTTEKPSFQRNKRIRLVAPIGGVTIGVR